MQSQVKINMGRKVSIIQMRIKSAQKIVGGVTDKPFENRTRHVSHGITPE